MNTFAMNPAMRPLAETPANRGGTDAAEPREAAGNPFGAVLGALKESSSRPRGSATSKPEAPAGTAAEPADPLAILAVSAPAEPVRKAGREVFDALVARAASERPPGGTAGETATIVVPAAVALPAVGAIAESAERMPADPDTSDPEQPDPASQAGVSSSLTLSVLPVPERAAQGGSVDAASVAAFPSTLPATPEAFAGAESRMRVTVLRQETHFAPVMPRSVRIPANGAAPAGNPVTDAVIAPPTAATPEPVSGDGRVVTALTPDAVRPGQEGPVPSLPHEAVKAIDPAPVPVSQERGGPATLADGGGTPVMARSTASAEPPAAAAAAAFPDAAVKAAPAAVAAQQPLPSQAPTAPAASPSGEPVRAIEPEHAPAADSEGRPHQPAIAPSATETVAPAERDHGAEVGAGAVAPQPAVSTAAAASGAPLSSPAAQIAEAVATEALRAASAPSGVPTAVTGADGPLRILTLQLRPADMGNVVVRMRLRGNQLEMSLHASREETAELLRKDGAVLNALLRDAGYRPDAVTIGSPLQEASHGNGPTSGQSFQPGSGGQNPARDMSDQPARRQPGSGAEPTTDTRERTHETNSASPDRGGVYL